MTEMGFTYALFMSTVFHNAPRRCPNWSLRLLFTTFMLPSSSSCVMVPSDRMFDLVAVRDTPYAEPTIDQKFVHLDLGFECPKRPDSGS